MDQSKKPVEGLAQRAQRRRGCAEGNLQPRKQSSQRAANVSSASASSPCIETSGLFPAQPLRLCATLRDKYNHVFILTHNYNLRAVRPEIHFVFYLKERRMTLKEIRVFRIIFLSPPANYSKYSNFFPFSFFDISFWPHSTIICYMEERRDAEGNLQLTTEYTENSQWQFCLCVLSMDRDNGVFPAQPLRLKRSLREKYNQVFGLIRFNGF